MNRAGTSKTTTCQLRSSGSFFRSHYAAANLIAAVSPTMRFLLLITISAASLFAQNNASSISSEKFSGEFARGQDDPQRLLAEGDRIAWLKNWQKVRSRRRHLQPRPSTAAAIARGSLPERLLYRRLSSSGDRFRFLKRLRRCAAGPAAGRSQVERPLRWLIPALISSNHPLDRAPRPFSAGAGIPRLVKNPTTLLMSLNLPHPVCMNCHPQYRRTASKNGDCRLDDTRTSSR